MFKDSRVGEKFLYVDGSKSPSMYTTSPPESDTEVLPTDDGEVLMHYIGDGKCYKCSVLFAI